MSGSVVLMYFATAVMAAEADLVLRTESVFGVIVSSAEETGFFRPLPRGRTGLNSVGVCAFVGITVCITAGVADFLGSDIAVSRCTGTQCAAFGGKAEVDVGRGSRVGKELFGGARGLVG